MSNIQIVRPRTLIALASFALLAVAVLLASRGIPQAAAQEEPGMALTASGSGVSCSGGACDVPLGGNFTLAVATDGIPADGYIGFASLVSFTGLTYNPTADGVDEQPWPDNNLPVRAPTNPTGSEGFVSHGGLTGVVPPFDVSDYTGNLIELSMTCTSGENSIDTFLVNRSEQSPGGAAYNTPDGAAVAVRSIGEMEVDSNGDTVPELNQIGSMLTINCTSDVAGEPTDEPSDEEPTQAPQDFPTTGTGPLDADTPDSGALTDANGDNGSNAGLIALIAVVAALAVGGVGVAGWRFWQSRQQQG